MAYLAHGACSEAGAAVLRVAGPRRGRRPPEEPLAPPRDRPRCGWIWSQSGLHRTREADEVAGWVSNVSVSRTGCGPRSRLGDRDPDLSLGACAGATRPEPAVSPSSRCGSAAGPVGCGIDARCGRRAREGPTWRTLRACLRLGMPKNLQIMCRGGDCAKRERRRRHIARYGKIKGPASLAPSSVGLTHPPKSQKQKRRFTSKHRWVPGRRMHYYHACRCHRRGTYSGTAASW